MTEFDKKLIAEAEKTPRLDYPKVEDMIELAQSRECRIRLRYILRELLELCEETI